MSRQSSFTYKVYPELKYRAAFVMILVEISLKFTRNGTHVHVKSNCWNAKNKICSIRNEENLPMKLLQNFNQ
jgi:hypothetical protein